MAKETCTIGPGIAVKGRLSGDSCVIVAGRVEGEIALSGALVVETGGEVIADVSAPEVTVRGTLTGNISATTRVVVEAGGQVTGDIRTRRLAIAEGAFVRGTIDMDASDSPQSA